VDGWRDYVFQQNGAPAHNSKTTQEWCRENFPEFWPKEVWPPSSPVLTPWTTTFGAFVNERSTKPPTTLPPPWWRRSRRRWRTSPGTPWPRPAGDSARGLRPSWRLASIFSNKLVKYNPLNITCKFDINIFINIVFIAFLLKNC
jgi:hypothetical protein